MKKIIILILTGTFLIVSKVYADVDLTQCQKVGNNNPVCTGKVIEKEVVVKKKRTEKDIVLTFFSKFINQVLQKSEPVKVKTYFTDDLTINETDSILIRDRQSEPEVSCWKENGEEICGYDN